MITSDCLYGVVIRRGKEIVTVERKAAEVFAALDMESKYTKEEIFELYANTVYFGSGYYGIREAAVGYFGREPLELSDYECAMLAGIPNAPSAYLPDMGNELAVKRVRKVLNSMMRNKVFTRENADRIEWQMIEVWRFVSPCLRCNGKGM